MPVRLRFRSPRPSLARLSVLALVFVALVAACTNGGNQVPPPGGPQAVINSPTAGSLVAGTYFFSVQALDPGQVASVSFEVNGAAIGSDNDSVDGLRLFVSAADHPAGSLQLRALVRGKDGRTTTLTRTVTNVPRPASSAIVGPDGAALGTLEANGALSTLIVPPGTSQGLSLEFVARTKDEVKADTGVDYDLLGITFLGAQDILTQGELDRTPSVSSGGFGPQVQPGQAVVNYLIGPDEDGDGVGEIYVVNTATVSPSGDVVSDPVPIAQIGSVAGVSKAGSEHLAPLAAGVDGAPGTVISIPVAGFNPTALYGNVAEFDHSDGIVRRYGRIYTTEAGAQTFVVQVPPLRPGHAGLTLRNLGSGYASEPIDLQITAAGSVSGTPTEVIEHTLDLSVDMLEAFDARLAASGADSAVAAGGAIIDRVRSNLAIMQAGGRPEDTAMIASLAARIVASDVAAVLADVRDELLSTALLRAQQTGCNDILNRADRGMDMVNTLTDLGGYEPPAGDTVADMHSYAFDEWWSWVKKTTLGIDAALGGNACPNDAPNPPGPGARATPAGMGAAVPPGGNMGGNVMPPNFRPIPDYSRAPTALATEQARGRFVVSVAVNGSSVPFKGTTDAGGYFMIPMIPTGQPFVAVALDTVSGENRVATGSGPAVGDGVFVAFDFTSGESEFSQVRWDGGGDGTRWLDPLNWEGDSLPLPNSEVIIDGPAGLTVELDNYSGDAYRVTVHSLAVATGTTLELSRGTLEVLSGSTMDGDLLLNAGTLKLLADVTMNGDTDWRMGTLAGDAVFVNRGVMTVTTDQSVTSRRLTGRLRNESTVIMQGTGASGLTTTSGGGIVNAAGATFEVRGVLAITSGGGDGTFIFDNFGLLRKLGAGESYWTGARVNHLGGTVEVVEGTLRLARGTDSTGATWQVEAGALLALGSHTYEHNLTGSYAGSGAGVVRLDGGAFFAIGSAGATFSFTGGGVEWVGSELTGPGTLTNLGTLHIISDFTTFGITPTLSGHLANDEVMVFRGKAGEGLVNSGGATIANHGGATLEFRDDRGVDTATVPLTLTNDGHIAKVGGVGTSTLMVCYDGVGTLDAGIAIEPPSACQ